MSLLDGRGSLNESNLGVVTALVDLNKPPLESIRKVILP